MATPVDRPLTVTLFDEWGRPWSPEALDPREASYCSMALFNRDLPPHRQMASDVLPIEPPTPEDPWYDEVMSVSLTGQWWTICSEDEEDLLYRADVRLLVDFEPDGEGWRGSGRSIDGGAAFDLEARAVEVDGVATLDARLGLQGDRVANLHISGERTGPWLRGEGTFGVEEGEAAPIVCKLYRDPRPGGLPPTPRHPDGLTREDLLRAFEEEQP
jgi:hypothetical protein